MTLVVGIVWGKGVLVVSDSKATISSVSEEERKIFPVFLLKNGEEIDIAVLGGAGNASIVKQSYSLIDKHFKAYYASHGKLPTGEHLDIIIDEIQSVLVQRYSYLRSNGIDPDVQLLLATLSECEPRLYVFGPEGLYEPKHVNPGYALLGIGRDTGALTLLNLLQFSYDKNWDMGVLSMFIIDVISSTNPYVSPVTSYLDSIYLRCQDNKRVMGPLSVESFKEYKERVSKRIDIIRKAWNLSEELSEDEIMERLDRLEKRIRNKK